MLLRYIIRCIVVRTTKDFIRKGLFIHSLDGCCVSMILI